jgi:DNA-binding NtrC family response regulator
VEHIVVVDDDPSQLKIIELTVLHEPYQFSLFLKSIEALEFIKNNNVQIVISDYVMPELNGMDFLYKVKEIKPDIIRILMTSYHKSEVLTEALQNYIYQFMCKPLNIHKFKTILQLAITQYHLNMSRNKNNEDLDLLLKYMATI